MSSRVPLLVLLAAGPALACSNIYGIPSECQVETWLCPTNGQRQRVSTVDMLGRWAPHAYRLSPDGQANVILTAEGLLIDWAGRRTLLPHPTAERGLGHDPLWNPDSRRAAYLVRPEGATPPTIRLFDVRRLPATEELYRPERPDWLVQPLGFEWSPSGDALFVLERRYPLGNEQQPFRSAIVRIDLGKPPRDVVVADGQIDFLMPPVARFESGQGPSRVPYRLLFGHREGLFVVDPLPGADARRVSNVPAVGVHNIAWSPDPAREQVLLFFRNRATGSDGTEFSGVILVDLQRIGVDAGWCERLYPNSDVHTLWFSPRGTFATWGTREFVGYKRPGAPSSTRVDCKDEHGELLEIKGARWHPDERRLAITAGDRLFVHDAERGTTEQVQALGNDASSFLADPIWIGDEVYLSRYVDTVTDATEYRRIPNFTTRRKKGGK